MTADIYTVGHILTGGGQRHRFPRWLLRNGVRLCKVDSNAGPAVVGEMTEDQARTRFPDTFQWIDNYSRMSADR